MDVPNLANQQHDSQNKPGILRMTLESIFTHIFYNNLCEFTLKLSCIEINDEVIRDLLDGGKQVDDMNNIKQEVCSSVE